MARFAENAFIKARAAASTGHISARRRLGHRGRRHGRIPGHLLGPVGRTGSRRRGEPRAAAGPARRHPPPAPPLALPLHDRTGGAGCRGRHALRVRQSARGRVASRPSARASTASEYDPIFLPDWFDVSAAELAPEVKNAHSHRSRAFRPLLLELDRLFWPTRARSGRRPDRGGEACRGSAGCRRPTPVRPTWTISTLSVAPSDALTRSADSPFAEMRSIRTCMPAPRRTSPARNRAPRRLRAADAYRRRLPAAVAVEHDVVGQQLASASTSPASSAAKNESRAASRVASASNRGRASAMRARARCMTCRHAGLVAFDDGRDGGVAHLEHLAEQEHRTLHRAEPLQYREERERQRLVALDLVGGVGVVVGQRLGQPGARIDLARASRRAQRVDRQARRDRRRERLGTVDELAREHRSCRRRYASCTTSSASVTLPSMRYAIENMSGRSSPSSAVEAGMLRAWHGAIRGGCHRTRPHASKG